MVRNTAVRWLLVGQMPLLVSTALVLEGTSSHAGTPQEHEREREAIERFGELCENMVHTVDGLPFIELTFAPVRRLAPSEPPPRGTWRRAYETDDGRYPENTYVLGSDDDTIDLVSVLRRPISDSDLPPYLWHVISVPTPPDDYIGFIARHDAFRREGVWDRREQRALRQSVDDTDRGILVYVKEGLSESVLSTITATWRATFREAMLELVLDHYYSDARVYTHTFIYQDAPSTGRDINRGTGDRRNSSREAYAPGTAFGFVLDHTGTCLSATTLALAPGDR